jgi:hypothetical protein
MNGFVANELIFEMNWEFCDIVSLYDEFKMAEMAGLLPSAELARFGLFPVQAPKGAWTGSDSERFVRRRKVASGT